MSADVVTLCHSQVDVDVQVPGGRVVYGEPCGALQVGDSLHFHCRRPVIQHTNIDMLKKIIILVVWWTRNRKHPSGHIETR